MSTSTAAPARVDPLLLGAVGLMVALAIYAVAIEPMRLVVTTHRVPLRGLQAPIRALVIGDPQPLWPWWDAERLRDTMRTAAALQPDVVFFVGDYAYENHFLKSRGWHGPFFVDPADTIAAMTELRPPMGAFAVMGNHDWWWDGPAVLALLKPTHIRVLMDEAVRIEGQGAALWVVGLEDLSTPRAIDLNKAYAGVDDSAPVVTLSHSPDIFRSLPSNAQLMVSGHTHGGQVWLPLLGRPMVPIEDKRLAYGHIEAEGRHAVVTGGLGMSILPVRFMTPPELTLVELVPAAPGS